MKKLQNANGNFRVVTQKPNRGGSETVYLIYPMRGANVVGLVGKDRNTRTETYPYKAYRIGFDGKVIKESFRVFYDVDGGKDAALDYATGGPGPRVSEQYYKNPRGDSAKMTRQHFEFIARVIRELRLDGLSIGNSSRATIIEAVKIGVAQEFAEQLGRTNANFGTDRFITAATKFATNPRARKNPPVDALELVEEMVDKSSVKRVVTLVAEVCELKAQHVKEAWQDAGLAKTWEHDAKALINFVSKLKN